MSIEVNDKGNENKSRLELDMSKYQTIQNFIDIAEENGTINAIDKVYLRNQLLHFLGVDDWQEPKVGGEKHSALILMDDLLEIAKINKQFTEEDASFYEAALMNFITPKPSQINHEFWEKYDEQPELATSYFYQLARQVDQVKTRDIAKNIGFIHQTKYGELEITINLSKPEKDPKMIALEKMKQSSGYPKCALCLENEGLYGGGNHPARSNHRVIRMRLGDQKWGFQYSPYAYYQEHAIVFNETHQPMVINEQTFDNLLSFLDVFPHYMIGSNADLPIVGGSILTHDHYQAGCYDFPMMKAHIRKTVQLQNYPDIQAGIVNWPMSVLRLRSTKRDVLLAASREILEKWRQYDDKSLQIVSKTEDNVLHHTITPIARKIGTDYVLDLVFRDNNTSEAFPDGIFHPHETLHHIKKENIGLIEVMGLAILPPRLKDELNEVEKYLLNQSNEIADSHLSWANHLKNTLAVTPQDVHEKVQQAVGAVFEQVLQDAGVFKDNHNGQIGFDRFIAAVNDR